MSEDTEQPETNPVGPSDLLALIDEETLSAAFDAKKYGEFDAENVAKLAIRWLQKNGHSSSLKDITNYSLNCERRNLGY